MSNPEVQSHPGGRRVLLIGDAVDLLQGIAAALGEAGSHVEVLIDRKIEPPLDSRQPDTRAMDTRFSSADLLDRDAVARFAERYIGESGAPDILCITQSIGRAQRVVEATAVDWDRDLNEPLHRVAVAIGAILPSMSVRGCAGVVIAIILSDGVTPAPAFGVSSVLARAMIGLFESLRAELQHSPVNVSIVLASRETFLRNSAVVGEAAARAIEGRDLYSFAGERDPERISAYFGPLLAALAATSTGPPLPDIGPMGAIYLPENWSGTHS